MIIPCPSGFAGEIRKLTGKEAQLFADQAATRRGLSLEGMLRNCVIRVADPGPYPFLRDVTEGRGIPWDKMLGGDRFEALVQIRRESFGKDYEFATQCASCRERYDWELDLDALPRRMLSDAGREKIAAGQNEFETPAPGGTTLVFKLLTGLDEHSAEKQRRFQRNVWGLVDVLALRAVRVDGLDGGEHAHKIKAWLTDLDMGSILDLLDACEAQDCGVDTKIETSCPYCHWEQEIQLPFGETFFLPKRKKKAPGGESATTAGSRPS